MHRREAFGLWGRGSGGAARRVLGRAVDVLTRLLQALRVSNTSSVGTLDAARCVPGRARSCPTRMRPRTTARDWPRCARRMGLARVARRRPVPRRDLQRTVQSSLIEVVPRARCKRRLGAVAIRAGARQERSMQPALAAGSGGRARPLAAAPRAAMRLPGARATPARRAFSLAYTFADAQVEIRAAQSRNAPRTTLCIVAWACPRVWLAPQGALLFLVAWACPRAWLAVRSTRLFLVAWACPRTWLVAYGARLFLVAAMACGHAPAAGRSSNATLQSQRVRKLRDEWARSKHNRGIRGTVVSSAARAGAAEAKIDSRFLHAKNMRPASKGGQATVTAPDEWANAFELGVGISTPSLARGGPRSGVYPLKQPRWSSSVRNGAERHQRRMRIRTFLQTRHLSWALGRHQNFPRRWVPAIKAEGCISPSPDDFCIE